MTAKITVELPEHLMCQLQEETIPPEEAIIQALEEWLAGRQAILEQERMEQVLAETGLIDPLGEEWYGLIGPPTLLSYEELRKRLQNVPPLSEIIITEREEGR